MDHSVPVRSLLWSDKYVKLERFAKLAEMVPSKELSEKSNVSREDSSPISDRRVPDKPGFLARFKCFKRERYESSRGSIPPSSLSAVCVWVH